VAHSTIYRALTPICGAMTFYSAENYYYSFYSVIAIFVFSTLRRDTCSQASVWDVLLRCCNSFVVGWTSGLYSGRCPNKISQVF